jgi:hypothetical protein
MSQAQQQGYTDVTAEQVTPYIMKEIEEIRESERRQRVTQHKQENPMVKPDQGDSKPKQGRKKFTSIYDILD